MNSACVLNVKPLRGLWVAVMLLGGIVPGTGAAGVADQVVTSIRPVHALVSGVMAGVGEPDLIVRGTVSPHAFSLRPSDAANLEAARVVFLVGESVETSLFGSVGTLAHRARIVLLSEAPGLVHRPLREGGNFDTHAHGADDPHAHPAHPDHGGFDLHLWLDPVNAGAMVRMIADTLSEADPKNAGTYAANAGILLRRLQDLTLEIAEELAPARDRPFIVFHDAYQHFEDRFGLKAVGSVMVSPDQAPSVRRIAELRDKVRRLGAVCVFDEAQFESGLIDTIIEGTSAQTGMLDPLGGADSKGSEAYFDLIRNMAASFKDCLAPAGAGQNRQVD